MQKLLVRCWGRLPKGSRGAAVFLCPSFSLVGSYTRGAAMSTDMIVTCIYGVGMVGIIFITWRALSS
jgi:hypothetical protein